MIAIFLLASAISMTPQNQQSGDFCNSAILSADSGLSQKQISALRKMKTKDEFETSDQFLDRLRTITGSMDIAVSVKIEPSLVKYDADKGAIEIDAVALPLGGISIKVPSERVFDRYDMVPVESSSHSTGSYLGENALGAVAKVEARTESNFGIAWNSMNSRFNPENSQTIPMDVSAAKATKSVLRLMLVGTPTSPFLVDDTDYSGATIDAPVDLQIKQRALTVTPKCALLYNTKTGVVIDRWLASKGYL